MSDRSHVSREAETGDTPGPRRQLRRKLLFFTLVLGAAIWFAPQIIGSTQIRNQLLPWLVPDFAGQVHVGSASLSWLSPWELRDVSIHDAQGELVAQIPLTRSDKSLIDLASNYRQLGTLHLHNPQVHIRLTETGSNLDELLAAFWQPRDDPQPWPDDTNIGMGLNIVDGRVEIVDALSGQNCLVEDLTLELLLPAAAPDPVAVQLSMVAAHGDIRGELTANFRWHQPDQLEAGDLGSGELRLTAKGFPLTAVAPWLSRMQADLRITGQLDTDLLCGWKQEDAGPALSAAGELSVTAAECAVPSALGDDRLRAEQITARLDLLIDDRQLRLHRFDLDSQWGICELRGHASLDELWSPDLVATLISPASSHEFQLSGNLDLAEIASQLPHTLRLRAGTTISQGQLQVEAVSAREQGLRRLSGTLSTDQLTASSDGRQLTWNRPLRIAWEAVADVDEIEVRQLLCESDFLQVAAHGRLTEGQLRCSGDLDQLANQLDQLCELDGWQLAGRFRAGGSWQQNPDETCRAQAQLEIEQLSVSAGQPRPWQESQLTINAQAQGRVTAAGVEQIDVGELTLESGEDRFQAQLTEAVTRPTAETLWPLSCNLQGRLETWMARLQPWLPLDGWHAQGQIVASARARVNSAQATLDPCQAEMTQLQVVGNNWWIAEPLVKLAGSAHWDRQLETVTAPLLTLTSSAVGVRVDQFELVTPSDKFSATGDVAFRGDLQRVWAWTQNPQMPPVGQTSGQFQGRVRMATDQHVIRFDGTSTVTDLVYFQRQMVSHSHGPLPVRGTLEWKPIWQEATVRLATQGRFDQSEDRLEVDQAQLVGDAVQLVATGSISRLTSEPLADLRGEVDYDLPGLARKLRGPLGSRVQVRGRQKHPFIVRGPLTMQSVVIGGQPQASAPGQVSAIGTPAPTAAPPLVSPQLHAEAGVGWDALEAYGIAVGPQQVMLRLQDGVVWASPLDVPLSQGRLRLASRVELNTTPITLHVEPGTVVENARITPQMCDDWLKYLAPLVAGATTAEGRFSLALSDARIPLDDPAAATLAGTITIDGARVQPGPLAQQLLAVTREVSTLANRGSDVLSRLNPAKNLLEIQHQQVDFQMVQGRVYHRNLQLVVGDVTLRSQGWVGADQSLGLLAELPVQDKWIQDEKSLAGLQGQVLQIPIQGTLTNPQLDRRVVAQLSRQLIGNTAERLLQDELGKGLQKLLGPK